MSPTFFRCALSSPVTPYGPWPETDFAVSVVPLEPFSVSAACGFVSSLSVEDFCVPCVPCWYPVPYFVLVFRFCLIGGSCEALWLSLLSPPFCVIALVGHVHSPVEIFIFSRSFFLFGTDVPFFSRLD